MHDSDIPQYYNHRHECIFSHLFEAYIYWVLCEESTYQSVGRVQFCSRKLTTAYPSETTEFAFGLSGVRVDQSLVFCVDHCLFFGLLHCLSFFDYIFWLHLLITPLVSSNYSYDKLVSQTCHQSVCDKENFNPACKTTTNKSTTRQNTCKYNKLSSW